MDNYRIIRDWKNRLGKGGFGEVWKARNVHENKDVAVKEVQINEQTAVFIEREVDLMGKVNGHHHKNIIIFYAAIRVGSVMNFILEYCCHGDLNKFFKGQEHRVSFERCLQYMENITSGVGHLHDLKVCHRDLTPRNILVQHDVGGETNLKVADFGLGRILTTSSSPVPMTANIGTPGWQAPELTSSGTGYSFPVDIFSLGLMFLAMLMHLIGRNLEPFRGMLKVTQLYLLSNKLKDFFFICISIIISRTAICIWIIIWNACYNLGLDGLHLVAFNYT